MMTNRKAMISFLFIWFVFFHLWILIFVSSKWQKISSNTFCLNSVDFGHSYGITERVILINWIEFLSRIWHFFMKNFVTKFCETVTITSYMKYHVCINQQCINITFNFKSTLSKNLRVSSPIRPTHENNEDVKYQRF